MHGPINFKFIHKLHDELNVTDPKGLKIYAITFTGFGSVYTVYLHVSFNSDKTFAHCNS
jgi:hypothetical protein